MPRLKVDWQPHPLDLPSVEMSFAAIASAIEAAGAGVVEHRRLRWEACGGHHIGTTRMSADPREGVVDADCRVHGVDNLFIASSSVFPTSSHANPTMLVVALAIRLADHVALLLQDARVPAGTER
jgi:choline dehydrogenase-like flavoprotein